MYSTPVDLSFSYLCSAVEASLDTKKVQVEPNKAELDFLNNLNPPNSHSGKQWSIYFRVI